MYSNEYIDFLIHFHGDRDYFECHEILEEYWKEVDPGNKQSIWVGLILLAVAMYHHRRGNFSGAKKSLTKSIVILTENKNQIDRLGIDSIKLLQDLTTNIDHIANGRKYSSYNLPINDAALIAICRNKCNQTGFIWCSDSDLSNKELIHRHALRDRSKVIEERQNALKNKNSNR